jgi:sulfite exporter TauE/SafE
LERELKKLPGVKRVQASHTRGTVTLDVADDVHIAPADLERVVGQHGYRFAYESERAWSWRRMAVATVLVIVVYVLLKQMGLTPIAPEATSVMSLSAVFVVGVVAAFSSCTAVVAGLIAGFSARAASQAKTLSFKKRITPHLLFNGGRLLGFAGLGALIGLLGQVFSLSAYANGALLIIVAIVMVMLGIQLMDVLPTGVGVHPPKWLSQRIAALSMSDRPWIPAVFGALTFFLPCGFTQSMQVLALAVGDPWQSMLIMTTFALGTTPAMFGLGLASSSLKGQGLRSFTQIVGALVVALGFLNIGNGATLLGFRGFHSVEASSAASLVDGQQLVQMEVTSSGYSPDVIQVEKDIPVRWEIFGGKRLGCARTFVVPAFGVTAQIAQGMNVVEFTPTKSGTFVYSCSMGMVSGTLIVN